MYALGSSPDYCDKVDRLKEASSPRHKVKDRPTTLAL